MSTLEPALWTKEDEVYPVNKVVVDGAEYHQARLRSIFRAELKKLPDSEKERIASWMGSTYRERRPLETGYLDRKGRIDYEGYIDDIIIDAGGIFPGKERPESYKDAIDLIIKGVTPPKKEHPLAGVIERYLPKVPEEEEEKPREQVRLTPENVEWAIDAALTHYAEDWIRRNVRELLKARKRDEALKFLREHCRNFGVASPGKPYVHGTEKGILIDSAIIDPEESKLITWVELLKHVEIGEVKKLEEF